MAEPQPGVPQIGMVATVRNRRGVITAVKPFADTGSNQHNLVTLEYLDTAGVPSEELLWEREVGVALQEPSALPDVRKQRHVTHGSYDSVVRAARWNAITPYLDPDGGDGPLSRFPITSPLHGAFQVDDFQLVPLLVALRMPRISLLLADDVGLGKTIEAGLILSELIRRRRIRRILIACPASLCLQWQQEMDEKFATDFTIIDRDETHRLRRRMGMDANPWRTYSHVISSYYYLKQPDVLEQFLSLTRTQVDTPRLPWDLLIVDEAHNLMPSPFGDNSDLCNALARIAPLFEHKLFLTATPHNGHTRSFTGLLEMLDPVRFSQTSELKEAERRRIEDVVVRRLKDDINNRAVEQGLPPRFSSRKVIARELALTADEIELSRAFRAFRKSLNAQITALGRSQQVAGYFALEVLNKRLLSCPFAFADSWWRCMEGLSEAEAEAAEVDAARRALDEDTGDDRETESRVAQAANVIGSWMKPFRDTLQKDISAVDSALAALGLRKGQSSPREDSRFNALVQWIDEHLRAGQQWKEDERLVLFTEYKTTLDYLITRLKAKYGNDGSIRELYGGMDRNGREEVKRAFNDPDSPIRMLLATDTGSEGLNLQTTARYVFHYDVPWNPSRLEQRNGRLDRYGQARDVEAYHFTTKLNEDIHFLAYVVGKVDRIRQDLGSVGEVFDEAIRKRLVAGEETAVEEIDKKIEAARGRAALPAPSRQETGDQEVRRLAVLKSELDLDSATLCTTLDTAMSADSGRGCLEGPDAGGRYRLGANIPAAWQDLVDDSLRLNTTGNQRGALPAITFDPEYFITRINGRPIYRPSRDTKLLHLAHPMFRRAITSLALRRFTSDWWTVRRGPIPDELDALILLTTEELAVNELRETFHHWVRTWRIPVRNGRLLQTLPHVPAGSFRLPEVPVTETDVETARDIWDEVDIDLRTFLREKRKTLTESLQTALQKDLEVERAEERKRFQSRHGELSELIKSNTVQRLQAEIAAKKTELKQLAFAFDSDRRLQAQLEISNLQEEVRRRTEHYEEMRRYLDRERKRVLDDVLPKRFALHGDAQIFPVAVEIRLPEEKGGVR